MMGQLPIADDKPAPGDLKFATAGGGASNAATIVRFDYVSFHQLSEGPAALVKWLEEQGCTGFQYRITSGGGMFGAGLFGAGMIDEAVEESEDVE